MLLALQTLWQDPDAPLAPPPEPKPTGIQYYGGGNYDFLGRRRRRDEEDELEQIVERAADKPLRIAAKEVREAATRAGLEAFYSPRPAQFRASVAHYLTQGRSRDREQRLLHIAAIAAERAMQRVRDEEDAVLIILG